MEIEMELTKAEAEEIHGTGATDLDDGLDAAKAAALFPPFLADLKIFVDVIEQGSFSNGAEANGRSQSAVSRQIAGWEKELGFPLFERGGRGVKPTERAVELYKVCRTALDSIKDANSVKHASATVEHGISIRINGKLMTQSMYAMLERGKLMEDFGVMNGKPLGWVNIHYREDCNRARPHKHVVWQQRDGELRVANLYDEKMHHPEIQKLPQVLFE